MATKLENFFFGIMNNLKYLKKYSSILLSDMSELKRNKSESVGNLYVLTDKEDEISNKIETTLQLN
jgi:hypothetical protein